MPEYYLKRDFPTQKILKKLLREACIIQDNCCTFAFVKDLSRHIEYLLCEHDSVAIPSIGTFITEEIPARYCIEENIYLPPIRSVRLDITQTNGDGKLEDCLIQLHRVNRNIAKKWVDDYIEYINQTLLDMSKVDIGTIGHLIIQENIISFEVCEAGVNTPELYGLDSFHIQKLPVQAQKNHTFKDPTHFTIRLRRTTVHKIMTAAAMVIVALTVVIPNYGSFSNKDIHAQLASAESLITFFNTKPQPIAEPIAEEQCATAEEKSDAIAEQHTIAEPQPAITDSQTISKNIEPTPLVEAEPVVADVVAEKEPDTTLANEEAGIQPETTENATTEKGETPVLEVKGYCVVMASAITHRGAEHLIKKLAKEGFHNAVKHMDNGMLRVVLTGYNNEEAARAEMAIVRTTDTLYSGSWIKHF